MCCAHADGLTFVGPQLFCFVLQVLQVTMPPNPALASHMMEACANAMPKSATSSHRLQQHRQLAQKLASIDGMTEDELLASSSSDEEEEEDQTGTSTAPAFLPGQKFVPGPLHRLSLHGGGSGISSTAAVPPPPRFSRAQSSALVSNGKFVRSWLKDLYLRGVSDVLASATEQSSMFSINE